MKPFSVFYRSAILAYAGISILAITPCLGWTGYPGKGYEGWPKIIEDISGPVVVYKNYRITMAEADDQTERGTGGYIIDIKVKNTQSGKILMIEEPCIGARILEMNNGYPQIEIWGRGGGGSYSRVLFRVEHSQYKAIRDDLFDRNINDALRKDITAAVPGGESPLYYTGTMYPEHESL